MAISWPAVIKDKGSIRNQFYHVIDIAPTILEAAKIKQPKMVDGIKQSPIEGVSMMNSFDPKNANAPSAHKTQYFEMMGDRGIYNDGWFAATKVMRKPWENTAPALDLAATQWELYDLRNDWTQSDDLAAKIPEKLRQMEAVFEQEARKTRCYRS